MYRYGCLSCVLAQIFFEFIGVKYLYYIYIYIYIPVWPSQDLLVKLKGKRELHRQWKQGQVCWDEYSDAARLCRDEVRRAKVWLELNLARNVKNNKKG